MEMNEASNRILADLLAIHTGQDLPPSRRWRITTALSGLFREHDISHVDELVEMLNDPDGSSIARKVVEALLNNETYFFRDRAMFEQLAQRVLPVLVDHRRQAKRLTIWSVGCSTGQEALSLAMMFTEQQARWEGWSIEIFATDVSQSVIDFARNGHYSQFQVQRGLGVTQTLQWFEETPHGWRAADKLRQMVRFQVHNILDPLPVAARFDLILCRNLLLYFDIPTRERAFRQLSAAMAPEAWLMLGAGETVVGQTDLLQPDVSHPGLFRLPSAAGSSRMRMARPQLRA
jgi:chemotaxis protein methyltransferase CheR